MDPERLDEIDGEAVARWTMTDQHPRCAGCRAAGGPNGC
jgi:hypothetical protein